MTRTINNPELYDGDEQKTWNEFYEFQDIPFDDFAVNGKNGDPEYCEVHSGILLKDGECYLCLEDDLEADQAFDKWMSTTPHLHEVDPEAGYGIR